MAFSVRDPRFENVSSGINWSLRNLMGEKYHRLTGSLVKYNSSSRRSFYWGGEEV